MTKTILVLAANPKNTPQLRLDQEVRDIDSGLERAQRRDEFILKQKWASRPQDVRRAMLDFKPNIVHFCGHGSGEEGIVFEDETGRAKLINADTLAGFFELFVNEVECVVLNACYSEVQAEAVAKHIPYVIGMKKAIGDTIAIEFSVAFYDALGAGESIEFAYRLACNAIQWTDSSQSLIPSLKTKPGDKANKKISNKTAVHRPHQINKPVLFAMLREIFESEEAVKLFSSRHFKGANDSYAPGMGLSVVIQSLVNYCERRELLESLIEVIQREYPFKYGDFQESLYSPSTRPEASLIINRGVVELRLRGDMDLQKPNIDVFLDDFRKSLVYNFGLRLEDVFIMEIRKGSIIIRGLFSELAIDRLKQTDPEKLAKEFNIARVEILDAILVKVDLRGANLRDVDLSANDLRSADLRGANLQGAVLYQTILRLADLRRTNLKNANLQGADLRGANLSEADLRGASLVGANLDEALLEGAVFIGADLRLTNLRHIELVNAIYDGTTKMPSEKLHSFRE